MFTISASCSEDRQILLWLEIWIAQHGRTHQDITVGPPWASRPHLHSTGYCINTATFNLDITFTTAAISWLRWVQASEIYFSYDLTDGTFQSPDSRLFYLRTEITNRIVALYCTWGSNLSKLWIHREGNSSIKVFIYSLHWGVFRGLVDLPR